MFVETAQQWQTDLPVPDAVVTRFDVEISRCVGCERLSAWLWTATTDNLWKTLQRAQHDGTFTAKLKTYTAPTVLAIDDVGLLQIVGPDGPAMFFDVVKHPLTNAAYQPSSRPTALFPPGELQFILPAHLGAPPEHRSGPLRGGDDSFPTQGVSTRAVDDLVVALGIDTGISKSEVSRICKRLDEHVDAFRNRTLGHTPFPYVYLDATYVNVRDTGLGQVVSKAIVIATGITVGGDREILGLSESEAFWGEFCRALRRRGLAGRLVISDAHDGLKAAIRKHFTGASWQRCRGIVPSSGLCRAGAGMVRVASTSG